MRKASSRGRRPLTKAQLLPLPVDQVRRIALMHHLALAALATGRAEVETVATLANVAELGIVLSDGDDAVFRDADAALDVCAERVARGEPWSLSAAERSVLEAAILAHDAQLGTVPSHRYLDALTRRQAGAKPSAAAPRTR